MARIPIELLCVSQPEEALVEAVNVANEKQRSFEYTFIDSSKGESVGILAFRRIQVKELFDRIEKYRVSIKGFHPFIIVVTNSSLDGEKYANLFGSHRAESGLAVITTDNVVDIIIPKGKMVAYFLYYLARYSLSFVVPSHKNHEETQECVFDRKVNKKDIIYSMKAGSICDDCRRNLIKVGTRLTQEQFDSIDGIFFQAGKKLEKSNNTINQATPPRVFIASSSEGLEVSRRIQSELSRDYYIDIWNQDTVFGLGTSTVEALEKAVLHYDFAIFIFTPDDELNTRGIKKPVARDNVIFELGLFIGKLSRFRAFVVHPAHNSVSLPSDLAGLTTASYDTSSPNLSSALGPACQAIRDAVRQDMSNGT